MEQTEPKLRLLLIGPYPPPFGGIAMTIFDLKHYLESRGFSQIRVLNVGESRKAKSSEYVSISGYLDYLLKVFSYSISGYILHIETNGHNFRSWLSALICAMGGVLNGRRTIVAFGSGNLPAYVKNVSFWKKAIIGVVLKLAGLVICRNKSMVEAIQAFGVEASRVLVVPGFVGIESRAISSIPENIQTFFESHIPILGATVMMSPEYGVPLICESVKRLKVKYPKIGLILIGVGSEAKDAISELGDIEQHVVLAGHLSPGVVLAVMRKLTVFVRPTYFDGDSVSVREALSLGIPVVASGTPGRPEGVVEFQIGDCSDLCDKLELVLTQRAPNLSSNTKYGSGPALIQLYLRFGE